LQLQPLSVYGRFAAKRGVGHADEKKPLFWIKRF